MRQIYYPEGVKLYDDENVNAIRSLDHLHAAEKQGTILEGLAVSCTAEHDLIVELPCGYSAGGVCKRYCRRNDPGHCDSIPGWTPGRIQGDRCTSESNSAFA